MRNAEEWAACDAADTVYSSSLSCAPPIPFIRIKKAFRVSPKGTFIYYVSYSISTEVRLYLRLPSTMDVIGLVSITSEP